MKSQLETIRVLCESLGQVRFVQCCDISAPLFGLVGQTSIQQVSKWDWNQVALRDNWEIPAPVWAKNREEEDIMNGLVAKTGEEDEVNNLRMSKKLFIHHYFGDIQEKY